MLRFHFSELWKSFRAAVYRNFAARMKNTSTRRVHRAWDFAFDDFVSPARFQRWIRNRHRFEECFGIRMQWIVEQFVCIRQFNHLAEIHHRDTVADMSDDAEIVRNEEIRQAELIAQILEQVDDLRLNRHIKSGNRLVADNKFGIHR